MLKRLSLLLALAGGLIAYGYAQTYPGQLPAFTLACNPNNVSLAQAVFCTVAQVKALFGLPIAVTDPAFGAKCDGATDDSVAIRGAFSTASVGSIVLFPATQCAVSQDGANTWTLLVSKPLEIRCQQGGGIKPLASVGNTINTLYIQGSAASSFAQNIVDGCFLGDNSLTTRHGNHGIVLDTLGAGGLLLRPLIRNNYIQQSAGTGSGIFATNSEANNPNGGLAYALIDKNFINGGISLNKSGDSIGITNNVIQGTSNACVYVNLVNGTGGLAGNTHMYGNNMSCQGGAVVADCAASVQITDNELEQAVTSGEANNSIVDIAGGVCNVAGAVVTGNEIQANSAIGNPTLIRVGTATGATLDNNRLNTPAAYTHVVIAAGATGTVVGAGNSFSGGGTSVSDAGTGTVSTAAWLGATSGWSAFTASPTCGTATITTNSARSKTLGNTTFVQADFTITVLGTCTSTLAFTLPKTTNSTGGIPGYENGVSANMLNCRLTAASTTANCIMQAGAAYSVNAHIIAEGHFENQ